MNCPYCKKEMAKGFIRNAGDSVRWYPEDADTTGFWPENEAAVMLGRVGLMTAAEAESWYCADCRMVITPVPEIEAPMDKLKKKWDALNHRIEQQSEERQARREAQQHQKKREKQRKKDPWEV